MNSNDKQEAASFHSQGRQIYEFGQFDEALRFYDQALRLDPNNARIWYDKGNVFRNWHRQLQEPAPIRHAEAIPCHKRAVSLDPKFADAWGNMGVSFGALGDHDQALACFTKALEIQPIDQQWLQMKGVALQKLGRK